MCCVTVFRGKCCVTLLNETETLKSYLDREVSIVQHFEQTLQEHPAL